MTEIKTTRLPSWRFDREVLATILAPIGAGLVPTVIMELSEAYHGGSSSEVLSFGLLFSVEVWVVEILHLILAVPLYLLLQRLGWVNWGTMALVGAMVGLPWGYWPGGWDGMLYAGAIGLVGGLTLRAALKPVWVGE